MVPQVIQGDSLVQKFPGFQVFPVLFHLDILIRQGMVEILQLLLDFPEAGVAFLRLFLQTLQDEGIEILGDIGDRGGGGLQVVHLYSYQFSEGKGGLPHSIS